MKLDVKGAAERAGVCANVVYAWCNARLLRHARLGTPGRRGKILIDESDLDAFLAACTVEAVRGPASPPPPAYTPKHFTLD